MRFIRLSFLFLMAFIGTRFAAQAQQLPVKKDSSKKILLAKAAPASSGKILLRAENVAYPTIFTEEKEQSLLYVEKYADKKREHIIALKQKGKTILPKIMSILKKHEVPKEFALLVALESSYNSYAVSTAGAVGYWQFMDAAAKEYGLKIVRSKNKKYNIDERRSLTKSTHAAAKYLKDRQQELGTDWLLVAASYNCGLGNVKKAIRKSQKTNPNFWEIKKFLPRETQAYVLNFIAINVIFNNYESFLEKDMVFEDVYAAPSFLIKE